MSLASRLAVSLFALVPFIAATPAHAQVTADEAGALQTQLRAWVADLIGPAIDLGSHAIQVTPAGDAYRFALPLNGPVGTTGWVVTAEPLTVLASLAKPLDGGDWTIESMQLPTLIRADRPAGKDGKPAGWMLALAGQQAHGRFDPSLRGPSSFDSVMRGYASVSQTAAGTQTVHYDRRALQMSWMPAAAGRVSLAVAGNEQNLTMFIDSAGRVPSITVGIAAMNSSGRIDGLSFDRLGAIVRSIGRLVPTAMPPAGAPAAPKTLTPAQRAGLHDLVVALRDLLGGVQMQAALEHVRFSFGAQSGTLASLTIGERGAATGGMLDASLHLAAAGLDLPSIPQGPLRDYLPRRIALSPHVSGIPADDLITLLLNAIDAGDQADKAALQAEAIALLAKGPLKAGLDDVVLDLGTAVLKGSGTVSIAALNDIKGSGRVETTGLDALIHSASTVPELHNAAPFLIMLKGIGEQKGDITTWNITYANGHTEVNGTDMSALMTPAPATHK